MLLPCASIDFLLMSLLIIDKQQLSDHVLSEYSKKVDAVLHASSNANTFKYLRQ